MSYLRGGDDFVRQMSNWRFSMIHTINVVWPNGCFSSTISNSMKQLAQIIVPGGALGFGFVMKSAAFCFETAPAKFRELAPK